MICLDTTALIDFYKKDEALRDLLDNIEEDLSTTVMNCQEIFFGIDPKNPKHKGEKEYYEALFENLIILDLGKESCKKTSEIYWEMIGKGKDIGKFDSMIAGICLVNGVNRIITKNKRHFENIKGLKVLSY
jgi:tRNA(fMet)-specific endonuclease VapC